ncbi:MAG TPA: hypothetical protein VJ870_08050 [Amycolatopsis sp.]|nr:hypothetical protein [Amycolatopsis sp.]
MTPEPGVSDAETEELDLGTEVAERSRLSRLWRGCTGSLAAGLTVLAVVVLGAAVVCAIRNVPGPTTAALIGHPTAAVVALGAQRVADTRRGKLAGLAGVVVCVAVALALWLFWWD